MDREIIQAWQNYNQAFSRITRLMGGTRNIVGEFAENLAALYYESEKAPASQKSYDIVRKDGKKVQVKSRRIEKLEPTQLSVFRSFDFDILLIILFSEEGDILRAIEMDAKTAASFATPSGHVNGRIITTSDRLLFGDHAHDLTEEFRNLLK